MGALNMVLGGAKAIAEVDAVGRETSSVLAQDQENIQLSKYAEADAIKQGATGAGRARAEGSQLAAQQGFLYANSGVDSTVGTAANVQATTAAQSELNALTIKNNAAREAWGHRKTTANLTRQMGTNIQRANAQMTSTILGGLANSTAGAMKGG